MYAVYDGEEEWDGLWVDGRDEWEWIAPGDAEAAQPAALPVVGCWRPGWEVHSDIDKIYLVREAGGELWGQAGSSSGCAPAQWGWNSSGVSCCQPYLF